jgi:hypothetical protein
MTYQPFQNSDIFEADEFNTLHTNLTLMQLDIRQRYQESLDESHHGHPTIIETVRTGERGRPHIQIDPNFLRWAYGHRSTAGIARFLNVGRSTVRNALLEYGITQPQESPFPNTTLESDDNAALDITQHDNLLDPNLPIPAHLPTPDNANATRLASFTGPLSTITDDALDDLIVWLRSHFHRAGISTLDGMLRRLGHRVPRERIRDSLMRVDPVQRVFQRIRIRRRVYSVPGPNALWHHDGQHG